VKQSTSQREFLNRAAKYYASAITEAEDYLAERGITLEVARKVGLGVVLDPMLGHEQYQNRLSIPYITRSGVVDIRFRALDNTEPKYLGLPGAKTHLYNTKGYFRAGNSISLCEGEIDTITLDYACGVPSVGIPGVNNWKKHYTRLLGDFETVFLFADGDQAGLDFGKSLSRELSNLIVINLPEGQDVNSIFIEKGPEYFQEKIASSKC